MLRCRGRGVWRPAPSLLPPCWAVRWRSAAAPRKEAGYWNSHENRREFVAEFERKYGIEKPEDWKRVKARHLQAEGGGTLVDRHKGSVLGLLRDAFPERTYTALNCRPVVRASHLESGEAREFLHTLMEELQLTSWEEWAGVDVKEVKQRGAKSILQKYNGSLKEALLALFPENGEEISNGEWREKKRVTKPRGFWDSPENCRAHMDDVKKRLGIEEDRDWKGITSTQLLELGCRTLLGRHCFSLVNLLREVYPEKEWKSSDVESRLPRNHWDDPALRLEFLENVKEKFSIGDDAREWRKVGSASDIHSLEGGFSFMARYNGSIIDALRDNYPDVEWENGECRKKRQQGHWDSVEKQRELMDSVAAKYGVKEPKDWKKVTAKMVKNESGHAVLRRYDSVLDVLKTLYPEHSEQWKRPDECRPVTPQSHWGKEENVTEFVERLRVAYNVKKKEDWARISVRQLWEQKGYGFTNRMRLVDALRVAYPKEEWDENMFSVKAGKKSAQRLLRVEVEETFPGQEVREDYLHDHLKLPKRSLELDVYLPGLELALEYNGIHHYKEVPFLGSLDTIRACDDEKRRLCREAGIRLVTIPYWWDNKRESLVATLLEVYPGLEDHMDADTVQKSKEAEPIAGSAADAPQAPQEKVMTNMEEPWAMDEDPSGMLVAANVEGVRVYWSEGTLSTARGKVIKNVPAWWKRGLPRDMELDGVLSFNGSYSMASFLNRVFLRPEGEGEEEAWKGVCLVATDTPHATEEFRARLERLRSVSNTAVFSVSDFQPCRDEEHFAELLQTNTETNGSGLLLHSPAARYKYGRKGQFRVRQMQTATAHFVGKSNSARGLLVRSAEGAPVQFARCSRTSYLGPPPTAGAALVVGHYGVWPSGKLKFPIVVRQQ